MENLGVGRPGYFFFFFGGAGAGCRDAALQIACAVAPRDAPTPMLAAAPRLDYSK